MPGSPPIRMSEPGTTPPLIPDLIPPMPVVIDLVLYGHFPNVAGLLEEGI